MKKEIWGVNVIGRQGVNAENDFSIGQSDDGKDVVVKIQDTEISGEEFATLKEIAEGGPVPGGSGAIIEQDLDAIGFIPVANTYYQQKSTPRPEPTLQAFVLGQTLNTGDKMHFDTTKEDAFRAYIESLECPNGFAVLMSDLESPIFDMENPPYVGIFVEDMAILSGGQAEGRLVAAGAMDEENPIVFCTQDINTGDEIIPAGWHNLDANGNKILTMQLGQRAINCIVDTTPATWNGVIAGQMEEIPQSQFIDGIIYLYDGEKYNAIDGSGSGGTGDYNDLENIPITNLAENKTTVLSPFAIGDEIKPGDKIHFDTTKKDELATYLAGLDYSDGVAMLMQGSGGLPLLAVDLVNLGLNGYCLAFSESQDGIVFSTVSGSFESIVLTEGFMNLDADGNFALDALSAAETVESLIDSADAWNGTIISKVDITVSYDPQPEDGKFYLNKTDGQIYRYRAGQPAQLKAFEIGDELQEGDKVHFDTARESDLLSVLQNFSYNEGMCEVISVDGAQVGIGALNTEISGTQAWLLMMGDKEFDQGGLVYASMAGELDGYNFNAGFQNIDENGDYILTSRINPIAAIDNTGSWNGVLIALLQAGQPELFDKVVLESEVSGATIVDLGSIEMDDSNTNSKEWSITKAQYDQVFGDNVIVKVTLSDGGNDFTLYAPKNSQYTGSDASRLSFSGMVDVQQFYMEIGSDDPGEYMAYLELIEPDYLYRHDIVINCTSPAVFKVYLSAIYYNDDQVSTLNDLSNLIGSGNDYPASGYYNDLSTGLKPATCINATSSSVSMKYIDGASEYDATCDENSTFTITDNVTTLAK